MASFIPKKTAGKYTTIASGAITNGKPVIINADGTVSQVSASASITSENYIGLSSSCSFHGTTETYTVTVASGTLYGGGTGNVFYLNGISNPPIQLLKGHTYIFDQANSSNSGHPFHFKNTGGSQYTTGVTVTNSAGSTGAKVTIVIPIDATEPSSYYCTSHGNGMGNLINVVDSYATIDIIGTVNKDQSSLTAGQQYFVQADGTLGLTADSISVIAGTALSATELLVSTLKAATPSIGLLAGGQNTANSYAPINNIQKVSFTSGDGTDAGDLTVARNSIVGFGSVTRAVFSGGRAGNTALNTVDFVAHASNGNATDFGDNIRAGGTTVSHSNNTRGLVTSMANATQETGTAYNIIYYTIASAGDSTDFGDHSVNRTFGAGGGNKTRFVHFGGTTGNTLRNTIDYSTIASTGNATDFGDLSSARTSLYGNMNSATRCIMLGGYTTSRLNTLEFVVTASTGNGTDFGDMTDAESAAQGGLSNGTIGIITGNPSGGNEKIILDTSGNAVDFGDLIIEDGGDYYASAGNASPSTPNVQP